MAEVNWILKLGTRGSLYLHSQPPTSLLDMPNHMAEWAYEIHRVLTVCMVLCYSTAHSPQWAGTRGGGPSDRGPVLPLALACLPWRIQMLFNHGLIWIGFSSSLSRSDCCSLFILHERDTSVFPSFLLSGNIWILRWPCSISSFLKQADTFSTLSRSLYLMRKTSVDIPAFLSVRCRFNNNPRDRNTIAFLSLFDPVFFSFLVFPPSLFLPAYSVTVKPPLFSPETESHIRQHGSLHTGITSRANLASWLRSVYLAHSSSAVTSAHPRHPWVNIPITSQRRPVSIQHPRPSSSCGSPEAAHWPWVQLSHEAGVSRGKEEVTGDF